MPPNSKTTALEREGRLVCAINALRSNQISSIKKASGIYRVNFNTLRRRLQDWSSRAETVANNRNLNDNEKQILTEWILNLVARDYLFRKWIIKDTANMLRRLRDKSLVDKNWMNNYVKRTSEMQIAQSKKYDY
jgi:hypothetical protein